MDKDVLIELVKKDVGLSHEEKEEIIKRLNRGNNKMFEKFFFNFFLICKIRFVLGLFVLALILTHY